MKVYPTTRMVQGKETAQDVIDRNVDFMINEFYYGHRFDPDDIIEIAQLAKEKIIKVHGHEIRRVQKNT